MSGHSKWSTIKRQKGANDAKRGQVFTKLANAITVAVREGGGGDPASNFRLRLAIEKARNENMPKDNIDRAIERGLGKGGEAQLVSITYEGFGPAGIAVIVYALTDNKNRTTAEVKTTFDKSGGTLATPGAVSWQFEPSGVIVIKPNGQSIDNVTLVAIDSGATDVDEAGEGVEVFTKPEELHQVKEHLTAQNIAIEDALLTMRPKQTVTVTSTQDAQKILAFLDRLEGLDDVSEVFTNVAIYLKNL